MTRQFLGALRRSPASGAALLLVLVAAGSPGAAGFAVPASPGMCTPRLLREHAARRDLRDVRRGGGMLASLRAQVDPLKNERGNNVGDPRYTVTYTEDLKREVEDLPAGMTAEKIEDFTQRLRESGLVGDKIAGRIKFRNHFVGFEVVDWMIKSRIAKDRREAVAIGREMVRQAQIVHCTRGHDFKDEMLLYRFVTDSEKALINPKTPFDYVMVLLVNPPIIFAVIAAFLAAANVPYLLPK